MTDILKLIPPMLTGAELRKALALTPEYDPKICQASVAERLIALNTLYEVYYPFNMASTIYTKLYLTMVRSLKKKTDKLAVQQRNANHFGKGQSYFGVCNSDSFSIVGLSGSGKTSALDRAISLMNGDKVITLSSPYCKILPILSLQTPFDCSCKSLCLNILQAADQALGTSYYQNASKGRVPTDILINIVSNVCFHFSVLIIDEVQNVVNSRNGAALISFLVQLINSCSSLSICLVGTPESLVYLQQDFKLARRSLGIQVGEFPLDADFVGFCETLYRYKYVSGDMKLTDGIIQWFYDHSAGVPAVCISILQSAEEIAILDGTETVTIETLNKAYAQRLGLLHSHIDIAQVKMAAKRESALELPEVTEQTPSFEKRLLAQIVTEAKRKELPILDLLKQRLTVIEVPV